METRVSFPGVRQPRREGEYLPSNTEVKAEWSCNSRLFFLNIDLLLYDLQMFT
jgi:hypothetical protein